MKPITLKLWALAKNDRYIRDGRCAGFAPLFWRTKRGAEGDAYKPQQLLDCWESVKVGKWREALRSLDKAREIVEREAELAKGAEA